MEYVRQPQLSEGLSGVSCVDNAGDGVVTVQCSVLLSAELQGVGFIKPFETFSGCARFAFFRIQLFKYDTIFAG